MCNPKRCRTEVRAKKALWEQFNKCSQYRHTNGYLESPEQNLVTGIGQSNLESIKKDYCQGSGSEWNTKIRAVHSSSALVANTFGRWKSDPSKLIIQGMSGFREPALEKKCPTGLGGTPPNLDVVLESESTIVGIESKLLEPLSSKRPEFSESYSKTKLPYCEDQWWQLLEMARGASNSFKYFDVAQIIKHYLGLRHSYSDGRNVHLIYIYWQPVNMANFTEYKMHSDEIEKATRVVQGSAVNFISMTYEDLWNSWKGDEELNRHAEILRYRYSIEI